MLIWVLCLTSTTLALLAARDAIVNPPVRLENGDFDDGSASAGVTGRSKTNLAILLVGTDQDTGVLTDTILIAFINRKTERIALLSLPRDLQIEMRDGTHQKINEVASRVGGKDMRKGLDALEQTVNHTFGIALDGYARLDIKAFQQIVDRLGGIDVDVPPGPHGEGLQYDDSEQNLHINLKPGPQHLNGYDAMCFVRWRHDNRGNISDGNAAGDLGRMQRQQQFLQAIAAKVASKMGANKLEAAKTAMALAKSTYDNLTTNLKLSDVQAIAQMARAVDTAGIDAGTAALKGQGTLPGGGFVFLPDVEGTQALIGQFQGELAQAKPIPKMARIEVLNACGASQLAQECRKRLAKLELRVVRSGNYVNEQEQIEWGHDRTEIHCLPQFLEAAEDIKRDALSMSGIVIQQDLPDSSDVDVSIILGRDFLGKDPTQ
jgi:polyisoprenyl-teichoic acid--peptidoglycan teichoic acid transferase